MRTRTTGIALLAAVAAGSGAYALGSQAGDGSAVAAQAARSAPAAQGTEIARAARPGPRGSGPGDLAQELGVSEQELQAAFAAAHRGEGAPPAPGSLERDLAQGLARRLGVDAADVRAALEAERREAEAAHQRREAAFQRRLAEELGVSVEEVQDALGDPADHLRRAPHGAFGPHGGDGPGPRPEVAPFPGGRTP